MRRRIAFGLVSGLALSAVALGVAAPAQAIDVNDLYGDENLLNYRSTLTGAALYSENPQSAKDRWGSEYVRNVTKSAAAARAGAVYGNIETVPEAIPIKQLPDVKLKGPLLGRWKTPTFTGIGFNKWSGALGAPAAITAYQYRADIANGVTSWFGQDATADVCGSSWASTGFVNFLTGQDCSAFAYAQDFTADDDVSGLIGGDCAAFPPGVTVAGVAGAVPGCRSAQAWAQSGVAPNQVWKPFTIGTVTDVKVTQVSSSQTNYAVTLVRDESPSLPSNISTGGFAASAYCLAGSTLYTGGSVADNYWFYTATNTPGKTYTPTFRFDPTKCDGVTKGQVAIALESTSNWPAAAGAGFSGWVYVTGKPMTDASSDPDRTVLCTYTFSDGSQASGNSATFKESGTMPPPVCPFVPTGLDVTHMYAAVVGGPSPYVLVDQDAAPDPLTDVPEGFASNAPAGVDAKYCSENVCILDLVDLRTGNTCFDEAATCDGWMSDPNRDADYKCTYGGKDAEMQQCYMYAHIFNTAKRTAGNPYADPKTGEDMGGDTGPNLDEQTMRNGVSPAVRADGSYASCMGGTFSGFNPIQWILRPIQCGFQWALVPEPEAVKAAVDGVKTSWDHTPFGQIPAVATQLGSIPVFTGCSGMPVDIDETWPMSWGIHWTFGAACTGPMAVTAGVVQGVLSALVYIGGGVLFTKYVGGGIGFPGLGRRG